MILYKKQYMRIEAIKDGSGLYTIVQRNRRIFGRQYDEKTLAKGVRPDQLKVIKKHLANPCLARA